MAPVLSAALLFTAGFMLLASAATPSFAARLRVISGVAPLGVIEASHFLASIIGTLMLFIAYGLSRRLHAARVAAIVLCGMAAAASMLKDGEFEAAMFLLAVAALLAVSEKAFYRRSALSEMHISAAWIGAAGLALAGAAWIGFLSYERVPYRDELWWTFVVRGDASRFLRGISAAVLLAAFIVAWRALAPSRRTRKPDAETLAKARAAILAGAHGVRPDAWLALSGDKEFLFSPSGRSFIMYAPHGDVFIAMGGPVGPPEERRDMIWRFRERADLYDARPVFYAVRRDLMQDLVETGLAIQKIGETAIVPLTEFSLEGSARGKIRTARNKALREGFSFEVAPFVPGSEDAVAMRAVSDAWLAHHQGKEKGFSLGRFDEAYLKNFDIAAVRIEGRIVAFTNIWAAPGKTEAAIDLMRQAPGAPNGVMDFLFTELLLWAKAQGYSRFDLGMTPLAGLEGRRFAPIVSRIGAYLFAHGEALYGFSGIRKYKEKFSPEWEPVYIAALGRMSLPIALGRSALLTSGGIMRAIR